MEVVMLKASKQLNEAYFERKTGSCARARERAAVCVLDALDAVAADVMYDLQECPKGQRTMVMLNECRSWS